MHRKRLTEAGALQARRRGQQGFTLIEAVLVIVLTGVLGGIVSLFIVRPVQAHLDTVTRADLVYRADSSLRRLERELRAALPNSVRVNAAGTALEYIPTTGAARYATESGNTLDFGSNDSSFDLVGPPLTVSASQQLVFYNLGNGITGSDAYAPNGTATEQADSNRRMATNAAGSASSITLSTLAGLPVQDEAAPYRVYAVSPPVTWYCDLSAGTLTRYTGYGFQASQPTPPGSGSSALLAHGVTGCQFAYDNTAIAARAALLTLRLTLSSDARTTNTGASGGAGSTESVTLYEAVHVSNLP